MKNKPDFTAEWTMVITWFGVKPVPSFQASDQVSFIFIQNFSLNYKSLRQNTIVAVLYNLSEGACNYTIVKEMRLEFLCSFDPLVDSWNQFLNEAETFGFKN